MMSLFDGIIKVNNIIYFNSIALFNGGIPLCEKFRKFTMSIVDKPTRTIRISLVFTIVNPGIIVIPKFRFRIELTFRIIASVP